MPNKPHFFGVILARILLEFKNKGQRMQAVENIDFRKQIEEDLKRAKMRKSSIFAVDLPVSDSCVPFHSWLVKVAGREFIS